MDPNDRTLLESSRLTSPTRDALLDRPRPPEAVDGGLASEALATLDAVKDPADAVVDADGRSFDVPNLWVSDNSVFPSTLTPTRRS